LCFEEESGEEFIRSFEDLYKISPRDKNASASIERTDRKTKILFHVATRLMVIVVTGKHPQCLVGTHWKPILEEQGHISKPRDRTSLMLASVFHHTWCQSQDMAIRRNNTSATSIQFIKTLIIVPLLKSLYAPNSALPLNFLQRIPA